MSLTSLPLHPLVVHFSITFLCVFALVELWAIFSPKFRAKAGISLAIAAIITAILALVAKQTGEMLGHITHDVDWHPHGEWGDKAAISGILLAGFSFLLWGAETSWINRLSWKALFTIQDLLHQKTVLIILRVLIAIFAVCTLVFTFFAGHTGASLVWKN